jgi:uncharacterized protein (TIGR03435 family)
VTRRIDASILALLVCGVAAAQTFFDAASVKVSPPGTRPAFSNDPGRIHFAHAPLIQILTRAYDLPFYRFSGPNWISDFMGPDVYDITATMPPNTTREQLQTMLQNLLAERFHLAIHHESRDFPGYELTVASGGHKMKAAPPDPVDPPPPSTGPKRLPLDADGFPGRPAGAPAALLYEHGLWRTTNHVDMAYFADHLGAMILDSTGGGPESPHPIVVDHTGLTGKFDFRLEYAGSVQIPGGATLASLPAFAGRGGGDAAPPTAATDPSSSAGPSIFAALENQLGLKLVKTKGVPTDVIVIDHVDKLPTAN